MPVSTRLTQEQVLPAIVLAGLVAPYQVNLAAKIEDTKTLKFKIEAYISDSLNANITVIPATDTGVNKLFANVDDAIKWLNTSMGSMGDFVMFISSIETGKIAIAEKLPLDIVAFNAALKLKRIAKKSMIDKAFTDANAVVTAAVANGWDLLTASTAQKGRYAEILAQRDSIGQHQTWLAGEIVRLTP